MDTGFDPAWGPAAVAPPAGPAVWFSLSLPFGVQSVGTTSSPQTIRLFNYGSSALSLFSIVANGDFTQLNNCNGIVVPGADCTINVRFTPTASGNRSGAVTVTHNAPGSPHVVPLSGVGNFPPIALFTSNCIHLTCTFDGSASADPDGSYLGFSWGFGDLSSPGGSPTVSHTYATGGTYTVTLTVSDGWATATQTASVTVSPQFMHVGDLDGTTTNQQNTWAANVTVTVEDGSHNRVTDATVSGNWTNGGTSSCTTNASGQCTVAKSGILKKTGSATFTVSGVTHASMSYNSANNHDPDGDSNGNSITVMRP